jgi:ankyrin repeat protein
VELANHLNRALQNLDAVQVSFLLRHGANPNQAMFYDSPPLVQACKLLRGDGRVYSVVRALLQGGADPNIVDSHGDSPLTCDIYDIGITKMLLQHGANPNKHSHLYGHPLGLVTCDNARNREVMALLLSHGADPNTILRRGKSVLADTCAMGNVGGVQMLLKYGADPNYRESVSSNTALHYACEHFYTEIVKMLLDKGADPHAVNIEGQTPLLCIKSSVKGLGSSADEAQVVKLMVAAGASLSATDLYGNGMLHQVSTEQGAKLLIGLGANLGVKNNRGECPLAHALKGWGNEGVAKTLLSVATEDDIANLNAELDDSFFVSMTEDATTLLMCIGERVPRLLVYPFLLERAEDTHRQLVASRCQLMGLKYKAQALMVANLPRVGANSPLHPLHLSYLVFEIITFMKELLS